LISENQGEDDQINMADNFNLERKQTAEFREFDHNDPHEQLLIRSN